MKTWSLLFLGMLFTPFAMGQLYQDYLGNGHFQGVAMRSSGQGSEADPAITMNGFPIGEELSLGDASRFLAQASFGGRWEEIEALHIQGYEGWLGEQIAMSPSYLMPKMGEVVSWYQAEYERELAELSAKERRMILEEDGEEVPVLADMFLAAWLGQAVYAPDQLRQRVAFALSQILVISDNTEELQESGYGMASYYDLLLKHAFGNYRDLLYDVTLHPAMGFFLSHLNNPKSDPTNNIRPDENYAREVMQLFSIGLFELNLDGSLRLDPDGNPIPTYDNEDIKEFAKIFTGLGVTISPEDWDEEVEEGESTFGFLYEDGDATLPMTMWEEQHEPGPKYLLNGQIVPAGQAGLQDIHDAIDNLFQHPNVGPFLARRLIQRLVSSNPSPDYIARIASVFNNNGQGVRGDMGAVIKAILMDEEARACSDRVANPNRAMLREPLFRWLHFIRFMELNPLDQRGFFENEWERLDYSTGQVPLSAPSVFNFYLPDYQPNGLISTLDLYGPVFQIHNSSTAISYVNEVDAWTFDQAAIGWYDLGYIFPGVGEEEEIEEDEGEEEDEEDFEEGNEWRRTASYNYRPWLDMARDPEQLMNRLDLLICHGQLSPESYQIILDAIMAIPDLRDRFNMAVYLMMISPDYAILN